MDLPDKIGRGRTFSENCIKIKYPEFYKYISNNYPADLKWIEKLYWYKHKLTTYPLCEYCGKRTKFINYNNGYRRFCCEQCSQNSEDTKNKRKRTCLERYGSEEFLSIDSVRTRIKETCLEKYGVDNPLKCDNIIQKVKETCLEKYGVDNVFKSKYFQDKIIDTNIKKYGVNHAMKNKEVVDKFTNTMINKYGVEHALQQSEYTDLYDPISDKNKHIRKRKCPHENCELCQEKYYEIHDGLYYDRKQYGIELCTRLYPFQYDYFQNSYIETWFRKLLIRNNIHFENNVRNIISPYELDIYIPEYNIAIECNGCHWHSSINKDKTYHIKKYNLCKEKNITLLSFWEDQVINFPKIIEDIILNILKNDIIKEYNIKEVDIENYKDFYKNRYLYPAKDCQKYIGIFNEKLIGIFGYVIDENNIILQNIHINNIDFTNILEYIISKYPDKNIMIEIHNDILNNIICDQTIDIYSTRVNRYYISKTTALKRTIEKPNYDSFEIFDSGITNFIIKH